MELGVCVSVFIGRKNSHFVNVARRIVPEIKSSAIFTKKKKNTVIFRAFALALARNVILRGDRLQRSFFSVDKDVFDYSEKNSCSIMPGFYSVKKKNIKINPTRGSKKS